MTGRAIFSPILAVAAALLLAGVASTASANRLLNERWLMNASAADVRKEIAAGTDIEAVHPDQRFTPLMAASRHGNLKAMEALLEAGADPNRSSAPGLGVPLHWAADGQVVALLFDYGAAVDARIESTGSTPLHRAAGDSRLDAMHALIRRGAEIDARSRESGNTPLFLAARNGQPAAAQILIEAGAGTNSVNSTDVTPLHVAAKHNTPEMVELLLEAGADPAVRSEGGWYAAEMAMSNNPKVGNHPVMARLVDPLLDIPALPGEASGAACGGWRVQPGDTARIILADGVGDTGRWRELARLNNLSGRNMLQAGMCLKLPGRKATAAPARREASCDGHVVQAGDRRLGDIAEKALGDRSRWPEIARLNGLTAEKPHRLGQCLELPG